MNTRPPYRLSEAAEVCSVQRNTLKKWARAGKAPAPIVQIGNCWLFAAAEIDAFAARLRGNEPTNLAVQVFDLADEAAADPREVERRLSLALWAVGELGQLQADGGAAAALQQAAMCLQVVEAGAGINGASWGDLEAAHHYAAQDSAVIRAGLHAGEYEGQRVAALALHLALSVANSGQAIETIRTAAASGTRDGLRLVDTVQQLRMAVEAAAQSQNPYSAGNAAGV